MPDTDDDAVRRLENRAKFFAEGVLIAPFAYGAGKAVGILGKKGKELAYSNSKFERILDKFASTFRPRSKKSQELFEAQMRVEGQEGAAAIIAKDLVRDIDDSFKNIFDKSLTAAERTRNTDSILESMDGLLRTGKDTIKNNEVLFRNFDKKRLLDFKKSLNNLKISAAKQDELIAALTNAKKAFNRLQTDLLQGGNLTTQNKNELLEFFSERYF